MRTPLHKTRLAWNDPWSSNTAFKSSPEELNKKIFVLEDVADKTASFTSIRELTMFQHGEVKVEDEMLAFIFLSHAIKCMSMSKSFALNFWRGRT